MFQATANILRPQKITDRCPDWGTSSNFTYLKEQYIRYLLSDVQYLFYTLGVSATICSFNFRQELCSESGHQTLTALLSIVHLTFSYSCVHSRNCSKHCRVPFNLILKLRIKNYPRTRSFRRLWEERRTFQRQDVGRFWSDGSLLDFSSSHATHPKMSQHSSTRSEANPRRTESRELYLITPRSLHTVCPTSCFGLIYTCVDLVHVCQYKTLTWTTEELWVFQPVSQRLCCPV